MKYRLKLLITASVFFCLLAAQVAVADSCLKKLYIDGVKVDEASAPSGLTYRAGTGGDRITIGGEGHEWFLYNEYVGKMDEFALYAGVLSEARIKAHYDANDSNATYTTAVEADNPLLWLRFEDVDNSNGATALNSGSETARNGQYIVIGASAGFTQTPGINADSNALVFPATAGAEGDGSCVSVYDGGEFDYTTSPPGALNGDLTVEVWVNFSDINDMPANDFPRFFQHNGDWNFTGGYGVVLDENSVNLNTGVGVIGGSSVDYNEQPAGDFNNNEWHHVVVTYDSTYTPIATERYPVEVMKDNPALYIRFEEDDPCDYSGNNYWVEASDEVVIEQTMGSFGKAAYLNGGWVAAAPNVSEPCLPTDYNHAYAFGPNDLTVEFWLYYPTGTAVDSYAGLFSQCDDEDPNYYSPGATRASDGGSEKCRIAFGDNRPGKGGYAYTAEGTWATDANIWHHIVVVWDTTQDVNSDPVSTSVRWYTDNVNHKDSTYAYPAVSDGVIGPEMDHILFGNLGSRDAPGNVAYRQYIDEIAVYAGCLDRDENGDPNLDRIKAHYEAWDPKTCEEWRDREMPMPAFDINHDCKIDFFDFASFALSWDTCNDPCDPGCVPPEW